MKYKLLNNFFYIIDRINKTPRIKWNKILIYNYYSDSGKFFFTPYTTNTKKINNIFLGAIFTNLNSINLAI